MKGQWIQRNERKKRLALQKPTTYNFSKPGSEEEEARG
jgi:hypothetical protein